MATWQGIVRVGGTPVAKCYFTAYYRNSAGGGAAGPGNGVRASQWMSGVYLTESSGQGTVALSSDNFLGAGATVNANDQLIVILWRDSALTPADAAGFFYAGQSRTDGKSGTHGLGFKYDNGAAAQANYQTANQFYVATFTMTGQAWNATPGGVGGDVNGDISLVVNAAPTAVLTGLSTNLAVPTATTRAVAQALANGSSDLQTNRLYSFNGQIVFEQSSAAHNPSGGTQTVDGSAIDGSRYSFPDGLSYGAPSGQATDITYPGPAFQSHSHTFPSIDLYRVDLVVKDDSSPALTGTTSVYLRSFYRTVAAALGQRQYCSWTQYLSAPTEANASFSILNPNTVADVVRVPATITAVDDSVGRLGGEVRLTAAITLNGSAAQVLALDPTLLPASAPFGFLTFLTRAGSDVRECYRIVARGAGTLTIDTAGQTRSYTTRDWFRLSTEPFGGNDVHFDWEVSVSAGAWTKLGSAAQALAAPLSGTTVVLTGIGANVLPGWWLRVRDGAARGRYRIASVPSDNQLVLATACAAAAGDTIEIGCRDADALWSQSENDGLDFRILATFVDGWNLQGLTVAQGGVVNNLPPQAVAVVDSDETSATTYLFDGRRSHGTQTTWVQDGTLVGAHTLTGAAAFTLTDAALNTTGLRDGHAWLLILTDERVTAVFPIVDLDRETPSIQTITIDCRGQTLALTAGTRFRTTNVYEIEGTNLDNDVTTYAWRLRSAATVQVLPTTAAEFLVRFDRDDSSGAGGEWQYTYSEADDGRFACVELTVTDPEGATHTTWQLFTIEITESVAPRTRRLEWE